MTGTIINVAAILAGTLIGVLAGARLPQGLQHRVLAGLGLVTLVIGGPGDRLVHLVDAVPVKVRACPWPAITCRVTF